MPDTTAIPADPTGAVSSTRVVTFANGGDSGGFRIHDRTGALLESESLNGFWGNSGTFDPRAVYDPVGNRFIVTTLWGPQAMRSFGLAVSTSSSPSTSDDFHKYVWRFDSSGDCAADYSTVGFNKNWIVLSYHLEHMGTCGFSGGTAILVFEKAKAYAGQSLSYTYWHIQQSALCSGPCDKAVMPATTFSSTLDTLYLLNEHNQNTGELQLRTITGSVSSPVLSNAVVIDAPNGATWTGPPDAPQDDPSHPLLETLGPKIDTLMYRNGDLWAAHTVGLTDGGVTRSAVQWWEINPSVSPPVVKQFGRVDDTSGRHRIFGSMAVNTNDDVLFGYTLASSTMHPAAAYAWRQGNTAKSQEGAIDIIYQAGAGGYTEHPRWGDYSTTVVDPTGNSRHMWTLQQHTTANTGQWSAQWQRVTFYDGPFDPTFLEVRGNEWWVQTKVSTSSAAVEKVEVSINGGTWKALSWQGWGWGGSYQIIQNSVIQLRAHSVDGSMVLSNCYKWIPPANTDATQVPCVYTFDATFAPVPGNEWWVETGVTANQPIATVQARVNCGATWATLPPTSWGTYAKSFFVASGSKVDFRATSSTSGQTDYSGAYIWPSATPTTPC